MIVDWIQFPVGSHKKRSTRGLSSLVHGFNSWVQG